MPVNTLQEHRPERVRDALMAGASHWQGVPVFQDRATSPEAPECTFIVRTNELMWIHYLWSPDLYSALTKGGYLAIIVN